MVISQINDKAIANTSSLSDVSKSNISEVNDIDMPPSSSFSDSYAVANSISTGTGQAVYIENGQGLMNYIHSDAYTISFWVKAGWNSSLNTNIHLFSSTTSGSTDSSSNMIRIYYHESLNRLYFEYRSASNAKKSNFWLFHSTSGRYNTAYQAANLGSSYWSNTNRGNTGDNDFTMITLTKGTSNNASPSNATMYWNASTLGDGQYTSGTGQGTPNMEAVNRQVALGSNTWTYAKSGNNVETQYNDLTIWNKKLSASEVSELYNGGTRLDATQHSAVEDLNGYYKFENNGLDSSGNENPSFSVTGNSNYESI